MRPQILNYLFSPITILNGIGPKASNTFKRLLGVKATEESENGSGSKKYGFCRILDLVFHKPTDVIERIENPHLFDVKDGDVVTVKVTVESHEKPSRKGRPYRIICYNPSGYITVVFFQFYQDYIDKNFPIGAEIVISGKAERYSGGLQMPHPDYVVRPKDIDKIKKIEAKYPLVAGVSQKFLSKAIDGALQNVPELPEWVDSGLIKQEKWPNWRDSLINLHNPERKDDLEPHSLHIKRLSYDELLANQLSMAIVKRNISYDSGEYHNIDTGANSLRRKLLDLLPFKLTGGQERVLADIDDDLRSNKKMLRLLQGDVGAGKTVVALLSAVSMVQLGKQVAFMAPTSILANQHFEGIKKLLKCDAAERECECDSELSNIRVELLTGKVKGKKREKILQDLANGEIDILVGTHAIFQEGVEFKSLSYVVIDEQQRFGVLQRLALAQKGAKPDVLLMSATPIPRTLMLASYGDIDISVLQEKPMNRIPIDTRILPNTRLDEVRSGLQRVIDSGDKVYWVCPLVEESEVVKMTAAEDRFLEFQKVFGEDKVALIHGRMKPKEKDKIMEDFANPEGSVKILVATTVIEVGVDVSDATIMVIEHAEHFGLSQLHQLRGRVGRGDKKSYCILVYDKESGYNAGKRLKIMRETNDGFVIAEEDLRLRGSGELLGTQQSGFPGYKFANLLVHYDLLKIASKQARMILEKWKTKNPDDLPENVRTLLYLFDFNEYLDIIDAG